MTARHQIRIGRRLGRDRTAIDAAPAPRLGETLQLARERKGVDLFRAERDTKIRLKYLAALEDSDFDELPAPVYTKGFLRNYAIYLGLDPEEVLARWRDEMIQVRGRRAERPAVVAPPRPIAAPKGGIKISPGWVMAALVMLAVAGFVAYIGLQLLRFAEAPGVSLTEPANLVSVSHGESTIFSGISGAGALITIHGQDGQLLNTTADESGNWSREVPLAPGQNNFSIIANDPVTRRDSPPLQVIVTVPVAGESPGASPTAPAAELRLTLASPAEGASLDSGQLTVSGSTTGSRVSVEARPLDGQAPPTAEPSESPTTDPDDSPEPGDSPQPADPSTEVAVGASGAFSASLQLTPGRWEIVATAFSSGLQPVSQRRTVTITQADQLVLVIEAARGDSWMRIVVDGEVLRGWGGPTLRQGSTVTVSASEEVWLRAGNSGVIRVTQDGVELGNLGRRGQVANWIFRAGQQPEQTSETR